MAPPSKKNKSISETFPYPALPAGVDSIRILTVNPGDFYDPLTCTLASATFSSKPAYVALSYTWHDPYPDSVALPVSPHDAKVPYQSSRVTAEQAERASTTASDYPAKRREQTKYLSSIQTITLNERSFPLHRNLFLALLHLRSPTHPLALWVDAICINQEDTEERNAQVAMMSFVYTRALNVVAWLGIKNYEKQRDTFWSMSLDWRTGEACRYAAFMADGATLNYSRGPDQSTLARIAESSYWTRLWIVQELCLPRLLTFIYGSSMWRYDDLRKCEAMKKAMKKARSRISNSLVTQHEDNSFLAMLRLLDTREMRHTDHMRLENLIEIFANNSCTELRDRIYGLLGLAHDVSPVIGADTALNPVDKDVKEMDKQLNNISDHQRRTRSFKVDYARSFHDIWSDLVQFAYFKTINVEQQFDKLYIASLSAFWQQERHISVVRTAGIIQEALGQKVEEEIGADRCLKSGIETPTIRAIGYISGQITQLGPRYELLIASFRAQQQWLDCINGAYQKASDLELLRKINEEYIAKIMGFEESDLARIQEIRNPAVMAWSATKGHKPPSFDPSSAIKDDRTFCYPGGNDSKHNNSKGPRICIGTSHTIAVVPSAAEVDDVIVRFWNCDAAIVMRRVDPLSYKRVTTENSDSLFMPVGRADVANAVNTINVLLEDIPAQGSEAAVTVNLDLQTLQMITASTCTNRKKKP